MTSSPDVILVGGGVAGLMAAYALGQQGVAVHLYERQSFAQESSWAGGGILSPLYPWRYPEAVNQLAQRSIQLYPAWVAALQAESGVDPELFQSGMLIGLSEPSQEVQLWLKTYAQKHEWLSPEAMRKQFQGFHPQAARGLWLPEMGNIRNPRLLKSLLASVRCLPSVKLFEHTPVAEILTQADICTGVKLARDESVYAKQTVICAGAWSGDLSPSGSPLAVKPVKGQMILFHPSACVKSMLLEDERYFIPRKDGRVLVGSSVEDVGFEKDTTKAVRQALEDFAYARFPALKSVGVETHWAGLRPSSPQGIPFIGQSPVYSGLFFNTGHFRNGLILQPASVEKLMGAMGYLAPF